jgi:hypothetical protein
MSDASVLALAVAAVLCVVAVCLTVIATALIRERQGRRDWNR